MEGEVLEAREEGWLQVRLTIFGRPVVLRLETYQVELVHLTEAYWLACNDVGRLQTHICACSPPSERKLRLFACACARLLSNWLPLDVHRQAIETAENFADGKTGAAVLLAAHRQVAGALAALRQKRPGSRTRGATSLWAVETASGPRERLWEAWGAVQVSNLPKNAGCPAALLRDVLGNPFRPITVDVAWVNFANDTVRHLAKAIYHERAYRDLPILADALEDAGCDNAELLNHCRHPGAHVRGCWALDCLLGKS
jgi:hypothetical protein